MSSFEKKSIEISRIEGKKLSKEELRVVANYALYLCECGDFDFFDYLKVHKPVSLSSELIDFDSENKINLLRLFIGEGKTELNKDMMANLIKSAMNPFHLELFTELRNKEPVLAAKLAVEKKDEEIIAALLDIAIKNSIDVYLQNYFKLLWHSGNSMILIHAQLDVRLLKTYLEILKNIGGRKHCKLLEAYAILNPNYFEFDKKADLEECQIKGLYTHQTKLALIVGASDITMDILVEEYENGILQGDFDDPGYFKGYKHKITDQCVSTVEKLFEKVTLREEIKQMLLVFYDFENCELFQKLLDKNEGFILEILKYGLELHKSKLHCSNSFKNYYSQNALPLDLVLLQLFLHTDKSVKVYPKLKILMSLFHSIVGPNICESIASINQQTATELYNWMYRFVLERTDYYSVFLGTVRHLTFALHLKLNHHATYDVECMKFYHFASWSKQVFLNQIGVEIKQ
eukprot:NODE_72_length_24857_cov_0.454399.p2 type:complete len:460 gc:universal NODE_72_length_24857_cov_0.454399:13962-15341(+)